jgi:hypothetical protein
VFCNISSQAKVVYKNFKESNLDIPFPFMGHALNVKYKMSPIFYKYFLLLLPRYFNASFIDVLHRFYEGHGNYSLMLTHCAWVKT